MAHEDIDALNTMFIEYLNYGGYPEAAVFAQWQHASSSRDLRYARWRNQGEVDLVYTPGDTGIPEWIGEIKWSDRIAKDFNGGTRHIRHLVDKHRSIKNAFLTTKTFTKSDVLYEKEFCILPTSVYCYNVGRNITAVSPDSVEDVVNDQSML